MVFSRLPTGNIISRIFIESSALEEVVAMYLGMVAEREGLVSSQGKLVELYSQDVMSDGSAKAGNGLGSLLVPRHRT
ncbi:hypothetical protein TNCV_419862 [Trichonephila clavipes]|uniref:Uncharacterized protein n=1 Tax=Trichonephila clavipes TaxID=2585209 RepID=A0A8X6V4R1_TRICX|nr:hypothetical protein TNCV_419862 [Trichonephila clavipes]